MPERVRLVDDAYVMVEDAAVMLLRKYPSPATVRRRDGVEDEMPTLPSLKMVRSEVEALFTKFVRRVVEDVSPPQRVSFAPVVVVPTVTVLPTRQVA